MTEIKTGTQPNGEGGKGQGNEDTTAAEAGGRGKRMLLYTCFNDGAGNYIDPSWTWFSCWRCGSMYYV
jgi:hypothetical protein